MHPRSLRIIAIALALTAQTAIASQYAARDRTAVAGREACKSAPSVLLAAPQRRLLDERSLLPETENGTYAGEGKSMISASKSTIRFIPNRGQLADTEGKVRPDLLYTADADGARLYFHREGVSCVFTKHERPEEAGEAGDWASPDGLPFGPDRDPGNCTLYRMDMLFEGANPFPRISASEELEGVSHYYYAHCPDGITDVPAYGRVTYEEIYSNIDLVYYSSGGRMKYEFIVHPGGDVWDIRLRFSGATDLQLDEQGTLRVTTPLGEIIEQAPVTYQHGGRSVESSFILEGDVLRYQVGEFDRTADLIIDPWATYVGGSGQELAWSVIIDNSGNSVIAGYTYSVNFPVQSAMQATSGGNMDTFIMKFSSACSLSWSTYYGGSGDDAGLDIAGDSSNNYLITGSTSSTNLPVQNALQPTLAGNSDAYILKLNSVGVLQMASYFGGSGTDYSTSIEVSVSGALFISVVTESANMPVLNAYQPANAGGSDIFIACFSQSVAQVLTISWATYFGGTGQESSPSLSCDPNGYLAIAGQTSSTNFPVLYAAQSSLGGMNDGFVSKFSSGGVLQWSTYFGGSAEDFFISTETDGSGNIWVAGGTLSSNFPTFNPLQSTYAGGGGGDAAIAKFSSSGTSLFSTYYGGPNWDRAHGIALGGNGNVLVTGRASAGFPVSNAFQSAFGGTNDAFVLVLTGSGSRLSATYYGGSAEDCGHAITGDAAGNVYFVGYTITNFPLINAWQSQPGGSTDAFFVALGLSYTFSTSPISSTQFCSGEDVTINFTSNATFNSSNVFTAQLSGPTGSFAAPVAIGTLHGTMQGPIYCAIPSNTPLGYGYRIRVVSTNPAMTASDNGQNLTISPTPVATITPSTPQQICPNGSVLLVSSQAGFYQWIKDGNSIPGAVSQTYTVIQAGDYRVSIYNSPACPDTSAPVAVTLAPSDTTHLRWTGSLSRDWSAPGNWNHPCAVPDDGDTVIIAGSAQPPLSVPRMRLSVLELDRQGVMALTDSLIITDALILHNGILDLAGNHLLIASAGEIRGGGASSFVAALDSGTLTIGGIGQGRGPVLFPVGPQTTIYSPLTLSNSGAADDFRVGMRYGLYRGGLWGTSITNNAVWLTWTVDEAQPGGSNAELTLQWNQADELNGFNRQRCMIARHGSAGWLYLQPPGAASGSGPYTRTVTGVVAFSPFSVGDSAASLPVRLQSFSASAEGRAVQLRWETASESGCHGFEVQRKMPGFDWMAVGFVPCANEGGHRYAYSDVPGEAMHTETELLYRLVMRDADGSSETSHELTVRFDESPQGLSLGDPYPQPAIEAVTVPFTLDASSVITMSLYTATGKKACVLVEGREFPRGSHALTAVLNGLAAGPYMLELRGGWAVRTAVLLLKGR